MKKIVASVGLVAVGATGLQADLLPGLTAESGKPFTLAATLRGFYDSNPSTLPSSSNPQGSFGFEISPGIEFAFPMEQTSLSFGFIYDYKWYEHELVNSTGHDNQTYDFHAALTHAFSERYSISVRDSYVIGQEPDFLRSGNSYTTFQSYSGNNTRNYGEIDFTAQLTPQFGFELGYANTLTGYADDDGIATSSPPYNIISTSNAGLMNALDNVVHLDGRYQLQPQTVGILGFQFRETLYTADQAIGYYSLIPGRPYEMSGDRDARSYYGYVGADHNFRPDLMGSIRAGARYTEYYNTPTSQNQVSPYAMMSLKYTYLPESSIQFGGSYDYIPSSLAGGVSTSPGSINDINTSANAGTVFIALSHRIMPKLYGGLQAQYQNTAFYGGTYNNQGENFYLVGLNLRYQFTPNFSSEIGYNYDNLQSNVPVQGSYDRNRVYIGVTGSY
jgi:hypothetical protein